MAEPLPHGKQRTKGEKIIYIYITYIYTHIHMGAHKDMRLKGSQTMRLIYHPELKEKDSSLELQRGQAIHRKVRGGDVR